MPPVTVRLDLSGRALGGSLDAVSAALGDLAPGLERAGPMLLDSVWKNFIEQGRPHRWMPLAPSTVAMKGHSVILFKTGRLMCSITFEAGRDFFRLKAGTPYASRQQFGEEGRLPARPFLLVQDEDLPGIGAAISGHLADAVSMSR
ncbi:MAG: phage virion morphogenesis protein [Nitrospirae bacterium]|nr:phage virion morphogenesis protein [Nitrospirota bacterium]